MSIAAAAAAAVAAVAVAAAVEVKAMHAHACTHACTMHKDRLLMMHNTTQGII
jgi:hypothetical protein